MSGGPAVGAMSPVAHPVLVKETPLGNRYALRNKSMSKRVQVIINPTAGQDQAILGILNRVFHDAGITWDASITNKAGDARRFAQAAVESGVDVVASYGGDGTLREVASGMI